MLYISLSLLLFLCTFVNGANQREGGHKRGNDRRGGSRQGGNRQGGGGMIKPYDEADGYDEGIAFNDPPTYTSKQPNVILFLIDDLGWSDISAQGGEFPTPRIDELYHDSVRLNRHYIHMMCSPSRTQYMTGRYAMYQGINKMTPWDYTEIGGIPLGQPVITQWLKALSPETRTYGVGKWHLGYAYEGLCPMQRAFDEWYGFLQGAVNYATKLYDDVKYGPTEFYDFWYNNEIDYSAEGPNSMYQYRDRFNELMDEHKEKYNDKPFFVYYPVQAIHGPLRRVEEYKDACYPILGADVEPSRARYCENTFLMDAVVGDMVDKVKENGFWDDTMIIFATDNGANLDNNGCNYPLKGTKGTMFEGNIRTIAFVTGSEKLVPRSEHEADNVREALVSNLDWLPTILDFTGLLNQVEKMDITWDGVSQKDLILYGDTHKKRDHIVLNVGLASLESCSVIFEHKEGEKTYLYKYVHSSDETIDRWSWYRVNGWCEYDERRHVQMVTDGEEEEDSAYEYLFELFSDVREKSNLLETDQDKESWELIIEKAMKYIVPYTEHPLYSERIECLWHRIPNGDPSLIDDGKSVRPFLSKRGYLSRVKTCFDQDAEKGLTHSEKKKALYFKEWEAPDPSVKRSKKRKNKKGGNRSHSIFMPLVAIASAVLFVVLLSAFWMQIGPFANPKKKIASEITPLLT